MYCLLFVLPCLWWNKDIYIYMDRYYVWWLWLTYKRVARVYQPASAELLVQYMRLNSQSESGKWWSSLQGRGEVDGVGSRHLGGIIGGAGDFKVGYKTGFANGASEKKIVPPLFQMWGTSKQISVGAYWIYWNLLSGCRINKHGSKDHFHWTAPPPVPLWSQKWGTLSPTPPVAPPMRGISPSSAGLRPHAPWRTGEIRGPRSYLKP